MTIGTGIFAAALIVILFITVLRISAAQRWTVVGKMAIGAVVASGLIGVGLWQWNRYRNKPHPVETLDGVRLGMAPLDVKLAAGAPGQSSEPEKTDKGFTQQWTYSTLGAATVSVGFFGKTADSLRVTFVCEDGGYSEFFSVGRQATEDQLKAALGSPTKVSIRADGLAKTVSYSQWQLAFELEKGSATNVCVTDGDLTYTEQYQPK